MGRQGCFSNAELMLVRDVRQQNELTLGKVSRELFGQGLYVWAVPAVAPELAPMVHEVLLAESRPEYRLTCIGSHLLPG